MILTWRERLYSKWPQDNGAKLAAMQAEIDDLRAALATARADEREPWEPYLHDRADGVKGHFCIARYNPSGYCEFLNEGKWCSAGEVIIPPDHRKQEIGALKKEG